MKPDEMFKLDYDNKIFGFLLNKRDAHSYRVIMVVASKILIAKPRRFSAIVETDHKLSLEETIRFQIKALLYNYYDLYDEENGVAYDDEE